MNPFTWLLSLGRNQGRTPPKHNAGKWLRPAAIARTHIDLANVHLPTGVVQRVDGTCVAIARVQQGWPAHVRSRDETVAFMREVVRALNTLSANVTLISRSRPGGLERYAVQQRQHHALLPQNSPLRPLLVDQAHHAITRMQQGKVRQNDTYLIVRAPTAAAAASLLTDTLALLKGAAIHGEVLRDRALVAALSDTWNPRAVEHFVSDYLAPDGDVICSLNYSPGHSTVTQPRYVDQEAPRHAAITAAPIAALPKRPSRAGVAGAARHAAVTAAPRRKRLASPAS